MTQRVLVTAGASGIGREIAQAFAANGANWTGQTQPRVAKIEGDRLRLSTEAPARSGGKVVMAYLEWRRAGKD